MNDKTISILGSGWLGLPLAARFVALGYRVRASSRSAERLAAIEAIPAEAFRVEVAETMVMPAAFLESDTLVVNMTGKDVDAFRALVGDIERSTVRQVIFVSSTSVYANENRSVSEDDGLEIPDHPLRQIETLFIENPAFETTIVRFGGLIGYSRHPGRFFRGDKTVRYPDTGVNLIHRDDCIGILERIVENGVWGETFNCCADTHPSKREFYTQAAALLGERQPRFDDSGEQPYKLIRNDRVKQILGYRFRHPDLMALRFDEAGEGA